ncbi:hypothetical protein [Sphingomonas oryzagri]|uniref:Uncharacterized protein n=1 Tax=Sphingomonas oryzagri TaxID=3042314 RepID=A0ABT6N625_9SPHN|nr:hypothetical protein [Sphingomonas oryzagri]MDH7640548.1 hypothetical protein [Sphingomonas oryzagri]
MRDQQMVFRHNITATAVLELDEAQLGALDALAGYGDDAFLRVFYKQMGESYLKPYEAGLRSLFKRIKNTVPEALHQINDARRLLRAQQDRREAQWRKRLQRDRPDLDGRDMVEGDL